VFIVIKRILKIQANPPTLLIAKGKDFSRLWDIGYPPSQSHRGENE
jgi:hypothetical protein